MSIYGLVFQWTSTITVQTNVFVKHKADIMIIIISLNYNLFSPLYKWDIVDLTLNNNHIHMPRYKSNWRYVYRVQYKLTLFMFHYLRSGQDYPLLSSVTYGGFKNDIAHSSVEKNLFLTDMTFLQNLFQQWHFSISPYSQ